MTTTTDPTPKQDKDEAYLACLTKHVASLNKLLQEPQPGLITWCMMYSREMQHISDAWAGKWADGNLLKD